MVLFLVLASCQQASSHPTAVTSGSPAPAPTPTPAVTPSALTLSCRLPVVSWYQPDANGSVQLPSFGVQAHYVSLPDGTVSTGAADEFANSSDGFGWRSHTTPALRGTGPVGYYDAAFKRFLPVPRAQVSPDGRRYVYMDYTQGGLYLYGRLHVVDVSTGRDRTLGLPAAEYMILDFSVEGVYVTFGPYAQSAGLWLVDPDSGGTRQVFKNGYVLAVAGGAAWLEVNENDRHPITALPGGEGAPPATAPLNVLVRRDLQSGVDVDWLRRPPTAGYQFLGVYGGAPAVGVYLSDDVQGQWATGKVPYEVWLITSAGRPLKVGSGLNGNIAGDPWFATGRVATSPNGNLGIRDSHGIWLGGDAIYLYQPGAGLIKVASFPGFPSNGCV